VKGHIYLIEAMKIVCAKIPNAQLVIAGDGRMKQDLIRCVSELGIEKNVFFIRGLNDTRDILSLTDVFVLSSLKEGLGLALMEAMAYGLPVIGSDIGGIKTLIKDGENGLLVKPADAQQLANAILGLLQDSARADFLAKNAKVFITENFSQDEMVEESEKIYLECLR
jgi:glycosyltransferase involved in cell wall biosynthesis